MSCKVLEWLGTELDISSWKLVCMERKRCTASTRCRRLVDIPGRPTWHLLRFVGIFVLFKVMGAGFLSLTPVVTGDHLSLDTH